MKTWLTRIGAGLVLLLEVPVGLVFYSLLFEPNPPVHGEGPIFYLGIEIMNGILLVGFMAFFAVLSYFLWKRRSPL